MGHVEISSDISGLLQRRLHWGPILIVVVDEQGGLPPPARPHDRRRTGRFRVQFREDNGQILGAGPAGCNAACGDALRAAREAASKRALQFTYRKRVR